VRLLEVGGLETVAFGSGVAAELDSVAVAGVVASALDVFVVAAALFFSAAGFSGRASCEDIIAGSTGAPLTVDCPVGARRAGGVYLLLEDVRGGNSCLRTPLYLG
jgi:hypothetical protein